MKSLISWKLNTLSGKSYSPDDFPIHETDKNTEIWKREDGFTVSIKTNDKTPVTWDTLTIANEPEQILDVRYPVIELPFGDKYDILFGYDLGSITPNNKVECGIIKNVRLLGVPVFALLSNDGGYYFDTRRLEVRGNGADYFVSEDKKSIKIELIHAYSKNLRAYDAAYGEFSGKWFDAAEIYRTWREDHPLFTDVNPHAALKDIDLWVWNRGPISEVVPPVLELKKQLPDCKLALNWYWWHAIPYDTEYPDFWPPREGIDNFKAAVKLLNENNIYVQVYINGVCWDVDGKSWNEGGLESCMMNQDGEVVSTMFNTYTRHRLGYMCGEGMIFRRRMVELVKTLQSSGLNGQYMDMISHMGRASLLQSPTQTRSGRCAGHARRLPCHDRRYPCGTAGFSDNFGVLRRVFS